MVWLWITVVCKCYGHGTHTLSGSRPSITAIVWYESRMPSGSRPLVRELGWYESHMLRAYMYPPLCTQIELKSYALFVLKFGSSFSSKGFAQLYAALALVLYIGAGMSKDLP
jgi:hypothetical protein